MPIVRILVESAALQFVAEGFILALYTAGYNAEYLLLEPLTPIVVRVLLFMCVSMALFELMRLRQGITFGAINIRIALHQSRTFRESRCLDTTVIPARASGQTFGSIPMRRYPQAISINITKDLEEHTDDEVLDTVIVGHDYARSRMDEGEVGGKKGGTISVDTQEV